MMAKVLMIKQTSEVMIDMTVRARCSRLTLFCLTLTEQTMVPVSIHNHCKHAGFIASRQTAHHNDYIT
jgi:hypothetical protein